MKIGILNWVILAISITILYLANAQVKFLVDLFRNFNHI